MSNYMDEDNASDFRDIPEEVDNRVAPNIIEESQPQIMAPSRKFAASPTVQLPQTPPVEEDIVEEEEEDFTDVLSDARLRLEQGRLYELVMNSDLFTGSDCDPKAIKNVEKEIRNFARERMEIMLGMRQETPKETPFPMDMFPFNALEVEALKAVASAATQGATKESEPFTSVEVPRKQTLNPIAVRGGQKPVARPSKPLPNRSATPVKRVKVNDAVQRILDEEGLTLEDVNRVFDPNQKYLTPDEMASLTAEQMAERNRQIAARTNKPAPSRQAIPMPSQDQIDNMYAARANQAAANPQMQMIMNLLDKKK